MTRSQDQSNLTLACGILLGSAFCCAWLLLLSSYHRSGTQALAQANTQVVSIAHPAWHRSTALRQHDSFSAASRLYSPAQIPAAWRQA